MWEADEAQAPHREQIYTSLRYGLLRFKRDIMRMFMRRSESRRRIPGEEMKHALCEWEANGYDDSDFFVAEYDDETGIVSKREIGSTRYAGGMDKYERVTDPDIVRKAESWLAESTFAYLKSMDHFAVEEPDDAANGTRLRLLRDVRHKGEKYTAGTIGTAFWCGAFGTFYRNGYNKHNRFNRRVGIRLDDGRTFFCALEACRLDREVTSDIELRIHAEQIASRLDFTRHFGGAWPTYDFANAVVRKASAA